MATRGRRTGTRRTPSPRPRCTQPAPGSWTSDIEIPSDATVVRVRSAAVHASATRRALLDKGVSGERVHYEVFGPDLWAQNADNAKNAK